MKFTNWLVINKNGIKTVRKSKPDLAYNEIACKIQLEIPRELFERPAIEATLKIDNVPNNVYNPDLIINTKELIEQQTGAKIDFRILNVAEESEDKQ